MDETTDLLIASLKRWADGDVPAAGVMVPASTLFQFAKLALAAVENLTDQLATANARADDAVRASALEIMNMRYRRDILGDSD